ncbi:hypothetical protein HYH03_000704 [Edaphochlamys debaryana]|uniref:TOG domain-containing protein n=1 Tax=Edaphochlamys debaryana TaxID=47281 RepID=A0A835YGD3_9CHLO|nr:hypothetical protein HYH03_000704 [Edaphochlamys debaryana]|eukprot:KAG2502218.1 hypothetical protein HYH03_000704 [Edaphochlamys debaryana]
MGARGEAEAFGFVPASIVADLQDVGNWKSRANAIDSLQKCLKDVAKPATLASSLSDFVRFLVGLVADPNFKIAISSMAILGDLAAKVGGDLEPHLREVVPVLLDKFTDSKILVRGAAMKVIKRLMTACGPGPVLSLLSSGSLHSSYRVREEVLNCHIMGMLGFPRNAYDVPALYRMFSACLMDTKDKVRLVALEGMAVLNSRLPPGEMAAMISGQRNGSRALPEAQRTQVSERLANRSLPSINGDGLVEHVVELPSTDNPDMRLADAAAGPARAPATPTRPRARGVLMSDGSVTRPSISPGRQGSGGGGLEDAALWSPNRPMAVGPFGQPTSRLAAHEALGGGPAPSGYSASWNTAARPGHHYERSVSPMREHPSGSSGLAHSDSTNDRAPALQPLKHPWGASRSLEGQQQKSGEYEDSPLSPTKGYQALVSNRHSGPGFLPHGDRDGHRDDHMDGRMRPASVRTQAAAELARGPPMHSHSHPPPVGQQTVGANGQPLWLPHNLEQENPGRQDTFSPSKAEMLARLKNRQIEKRVATAQQMEGSNVSSDLILAATDVHPQPRRYLYSQVSDRVDRAASAADAGRGYSSVANTPMRPHANASSFTSQANGYGGYADEIPGSAQRPPRGNIPQRLARGGSSHYSGEQAQWPALSSPAHAAPAEDSPARYQSPGLGRYRARSADVPSPHPPGPGAGAGGGGGPAPGPAAGGGGGGGGGGAGANGFWDKRGGQGDVTFDELSPVPDPERYIRTVMNRLVEANHADRKELNWQAQFEALVDARRLVKHHTEVVKGVLHEFVRAAAPAVDQLRSTTSKCALALFAECFQLLARGMDRELDEIVPVLIKKAGEVSNAGRDNFLAAEADRVLGEMCRCCGEARTITSLLACAAHKNPYVRGKVAFHLDNHLEACAGGGAGRLALGTNSACLERLFKAAAAFLDEGGLETRTYGKRIIWHVKALVGSRPEFDRLVQGVTPASLNRKVVDTVEGLNGPPPPPARNVPGGANNSAGASLGSRLASRQLAPASPARGGPTVDTAAGSLAQPPPPVRHTSYSAPSGGMTPERRRLGRQRTNDLDNIPESAGSTSGNGRQPGRSGGSNSNMGNHRHVGSAGDGNAFGPGGAFGGGGVSSAYFSPDSQETLVKALQLLGAKDFRERMEAVRMVEGITPQLAAAPESLLVGLLDGLVARLGDANAKVAMAALELLAGVSASVRNRMSLGLNTLVPALAATLSSSNDKIRGAAVVATDRLIAALDPALLVQHFSHCVGSGTLQRAKPLLVEKLIAIINPLYPAKPQLVTRYAVPAAFALLTDSKGETKAAANQLLGALARLMGPALMEQAGSLNAVAQQRVADAVAQATGRPVESLGGGGADQDAPAPRVPRNRDRSGWLSGR